MCTLTLDSKELVFSYENFDRAVRIASPAIAAAMDRGLAVTRPAVVDMIAREYFVTDLSALPTERLSAFLYIKNVARHLDKNGVFPQPD